MHPAAAGVLIDSLRDASMHIQVLVTSHSPDLLDDERLDDRSLLAVTTREGATYIGPINEVGRSALQDHLYTAGELLRQNQLQPDPAVFQPSNDRQLELFV